MGGRSASSGFSRGYGGLVGNDSYTNDPTYREAAAAANKWFNERDKLQQQINEISKELDKEVVTDPELGRQYSRLLGLYTERGKELDKQLKDLRERQKEVESKWTEATEYIARKDAENREKQVRDWKANTPDIVMATKKDYKGFELDTHTPYLQEHLQKGEAIIVEMSPKEYLQRVAYDIFNRSTMESTLRGTIPANVRKYARMMKRGTKFYMPSLNYNDKQQEGRHRALAAYLNGYDTIPVLIVPKRRK